MGGARLAARADPHPHPSPVEGEGSKARVYEAERLTTSPPAPYCTGILIKLSNSATGVATGSLT